MKLLKATGIFRDIKDDDENSVEWTEAEFNRARKKRIQEREEGIERLGSLPRCFKKLVLNPNSKPIALFSMLIILISLGSTLLAASFACFGEPDDEILK